MSAGKLLGESIDIVEVAVGFILVLLVQCGSVESLVIEFCIAMGRLTDMFWLCVGN